MTFDEARRYLIANFENMNLESVISVLSSVREEYAPTVEMTKKQYEVWNISLERSKKHKGDFIYFIDVLDDESSFQDNVFREKLEYFINDSKPLMQAWLHPETIKVVDE